MTDGVGVDGVGDHREARVLLLRAALDFQHRMQEVDQRQAPLGGEPAERARQARERVVVDALVLAQDVVDRRGREQHLPRPALPDRVGEGFLRGQVGAQRRLVVRLVAAVVHAEVDEDERRSHGRDVPREALVAARRRVAAPAQVEDGELLAREAREQEGLEIRRVQILLGDGIAEEDDRLLIPQLYGGRRRARVRRAVRRRPAGDDGGQEEQARQQRDTHSSPPVVAHSTPWPAPPAQAAGEPRVCHHWPRHEVGMVLLSSIQEVS